MSLPHPTLKAIREAAADFENDIRTNIANAALTEAFIAWPHNTRVEHVLAKVVLLNRLYSTNVYDVHTLAHQIVNCRIDDRLTAGDPTIVEEIARVELRGKHRRFYSFATKYCFWHQPNEYHIYDSQVDTALWEYQKHNSFAVFKRQDIYTSYSSFVAVLTAFQAHFGIEQASHRDLDRFLWAMGQRLITVKHALK